MKILITSGATREPIDGVRFISNFSTGSTGAYLADYLRGKGHQIFYVHGQGAALPTQKTTNFGYSDFESLHSTMKFLLQSHQFDCVIHAAAVSDFSVGALEVGNTVLTPKAHLKLESENQDSIKIVLKKNPKIVNEIKKYALGKPLLIAFKLTYAAGDDEKQKFVQRLQSYSAADYVIHNDMTDVNKNGYRRQFDIYKGIELSERVKGIAHLSQRIEEFL